MDSITIAAFVGAGLCALIACWASVRANLPALFREPEDRRHHEDWTGEGNIR